MRRGDPPPPPDLACWLREEMIVSTQSGGLTTTSTSTTKHYHHHHHHQTPLGRLTTTTNNINRSTSTQALYHHRLPDKVGSTSSPMQRAPGPHHQRNKVTSASKECMPFLEPCVQCTPLCMSWVLCWKLSHDELCNAPPPWQVKTIPIELCRLRIDTYQQAKMQSGPGDASFELDFNNKLYIPFITCRLLWNDFGDALQ